jgi:hypothetical protein
MKTLFFLLIIILATSCQVTETIYLNQDGSGRIETHQLRDENSYMQLTGENYSKEEKFEDTTYVFKDVITKYQETFSKYTKPEQELFRKFEGVNVHIKKSSIEKEFRTSISQSFKKIEEVPDLYKAEDYADDLENNYALTAEEHPTNLSFSFDGTTFKRKVKIVDAVKQQKKIEEVENMRKRYSKFNLAQTYTLNYHFPRKIKSVSNPNARISQDKKSITLQFTLSDCLQNPESTNLEVVLD